jgi:fibronectin type 3 domain-containing protein
VNSGLATCTDYYYRIRAYNVAGYSGYSNITTASTTGCVPLPPTGPANLSVQATDSTTVVLIWTDTDKTEDGYQISRATSSSGPWNVIATVGNNVTGYTDPGLKPRTRYYYKVRAVNNLGRATWKGPVMAKTGKAGTAMAPTDLAATVESLGQGSHIHLTWTDNATDEIVFNVYRRTPGKPWAFIGHTMSNVTSYTDVNTLTGNTYEYTVRAMNMAGNSAQSNIIRVTP